MKSYKILMGALAAGLVAFAAGKVQAGTVIDNGLYAAVKVKLTVVYEDDNGKMKKASVTSKEILSALYANTKDLQLVAGAVNTGGDYGDVLVYNTKTKTLGANLSEDSILGIENDELVSTEDGDETGGSETSDGLVYIYFYDNPSENSRASSDNWFEVNGIYSMKASEKIKTDSASFKVSAKASALSGLGQFTPDSTTGKTDTVPVSGTGSIKGNGKLTAPK